MFRNFFQRHPGVFPKEIQDFCIDMIELMARRIVSAFFMLQTLLSCFAAGVILPVSTEKQELFQTIYTI